MPGARDDYLMRMIAQAAAVLRRLRERLVGGGAPEDVARDAQTAIGELLGGHAPMLAMLDASSAVSLLADQEKVRVWIALMRLQAEALAVSGDPTKSAQLVSRADALERRIA